MGLSQVCLSKQSCACMMSSGNVNVPDSYSWGGMTCDVSGSSPDVSSVRVLVSQESEDHVQ